MVGALQVSVDDEIMLMSQNGVLVRTPVKDISVVGRNTQGVRLIRLEEGDQLSGLERIDGLAGMPMRRGGWRRRDAVRRRRCPRGSDGDARHRHLRISAMRAFNFSPGPAVLPLEVSGAGARRIARLARQRHVGHGDQPSQQGLRAGGGRSRGGSARADVDPGATTRCCSCRAAHRRNLPWCR